jgi:hypothetical protein
MGRLPSLYSRGPALPQRFCPAPRRATAPLDSRANARPPAGGFGIQGGTPPLRASSSGRCGRITQAQEKEDTMATRSPRRPTPEQRDARRREQLEQLRQATSALLTSEGWQRWLRTRSRFHRYSLRNTLLIAFQCPHATHVAGFRRWLELGRCVCKGEKAIRIFAPVRYRRRDSEQTDADETQEQLVGFKVAAVFDVSQTEPLPGVKLVPLDPPGEPVSGDTQAYLLAPLEQHAASLGFGVHYEQLEGRAGYCSAREKCVVIDSELPANGKVATLVHELAHAHGIDYTHFSRLSRHQ